MEDCFGKKINYSFKLDLLAEETIKKLIKSFWELVNSVDKTPEEKIAEAEKIIEGVECYSEAIRSKFYASKNPQNSQHTVENQLRKIRAESTHREQVEESVLKTSSSSGILFEMEDEMSSANIPKSPRLF